MLTILIITFVVIFMGFYIYVNDAITPDLNCNAICQTKYTEEKFNSITPSENYHNVIREAWRTNINRYVRNEEYLFVL